MASQEEQRPGEFFFGSFIQMTNAIQKITSLKNNLLASSGNSFHRPMAKTSKWNEGKVPCRATKMLFRQTPHFLVWCRPKRHFFFHLRDDFLYSVSLAQVLGNNCPPLLVSTHQIAHVLFPCQRISIVSHGKYFLEAQNTMSSQMDIDFSFLLT